MPAAKAKPVASYSVLLNGAELDLKVAERLRSVKVTTAVGKPDICTIDLIDPVVPGKEIKFDLVDAKQWDIGVELKIKLGGREDNKTTEIFWGEIVSMEPEFAAGGAHMIVRAYDYSHRLHSKRRSEAYASMTPYDMIKKVLQEAGLSMAGTPFGTQNKHAQASDETDWDFVSRLARSAGVTFEVQGKKLNFVKTSDMPPTPPVELRYMENLITFRPRVSGSAKPTEVIVRSWDPAAKKEIVGKSNMGKVTAQIGFDAKKAAKKITSTPLHLTIPADTRAELDLIAKAAHQEVVASALEAEGTAHGDPDIKAGGKVKIVNVGTRFSGTYLVTSVTHALKGGANFTTTFSTGRLGRQTLPELIAGAAGGGGKRFGEALVIGIVSNNKDPDGMGRVKVKFPSLSDTVESAWARVATPSAGKDRGLLMLPVVNEEVIVGFEQGDTRRPYVLGSLFNGKDKPGKELAYDDGSFALRSDKKGFIHTKQDFALKTDAKYESTVGGDTKHTHKGKLDWDVTGATKLKSAQNVDIASSAALNMKSNAGMKLETSASFELKGSVIQINSSGPLTIKGNPITIG
jgi:phage protein D